MHSNKRQKTQLSRDIYEADSIWYNHLRHTTTEKNVDNMKGRYFRFHDDNKMSYEYIPSIT